MGRGVRIVIAAAMAMAVYACGKPAQPVDEAMIANPDEWPSWGRTGYETHYSPLDEIDARNVGDLKPAWHFDIESGYSASTPIEADGKLFITTGHSHIRAFAADTGKLLWEYDGGTRARAKTPLQFGWGNRGVVYSDGKVVLATTDGFVVALDANTGKEVWKSYDYPDDSPRNMPGAPRVFAGKVIIGHGGADISPIRGYVSAYDLKTGKLAWRFFTVPGGDPAKPAESKAEEVMRPTWPSGWTNPDGTRRGGGGTAWNAFSFDPELGLIYLGIGNGYPYNQNLRSPDGGDNLFLASIVAVKADTGEYVWHYQICPGEQWDCTATADMTLATLEIDGKPRKVLMQAPKNGFLYVIDRQTGKLISAKPFAKVTWAKKIDETTDRPVENPGIRYQGKPGLFEMWPGPTGAHAWMPQAYSPRTGLLYIPVQEQGALIGDGKPGDGVTAGMGVTLLPEANLKQGAHAFLKAIDPATQKEAWKIALPGSWPAGVLATAGDLVFQGRMDGHLVAYDARTGKELWKFKTAAPIVGAPISYRLGGKQYVTVLTGAGGQGAGMQTLGNAGIRTDYRAPRRVLTFAIGGTDTVPPYEFPERAPAPDPDFAPDLARAQQGAVLFGSGGCIVCHGWNAVAGGAAPDLRYSPIITDPATFRQVVKGGALKMNGMPFYPGFSDLQLESIRFYLRSRAHTAKSEEAALAARGKDSGVRTDAKAADFAGSWNMVIESPVGNQNAVMVLRADGGMLTGTVTADQGEVDVSGTVKNGRAQLSGKAGLPMPITVEYDLGLRNDMLTGDNRNGPFGTFPATATRKGMAASGN